MRPLASALGISFAAAALAGCNQTQPQFEQVCTLEARPAIQVTVTDESGAPLPSSANVRVIATDGAYADTAQAVPNDNRASFPLAYERAGTYRVDVSASGYVTMTVTGVRVVKTPDNCHVVSQGVTVKLRRV